MITRRKLQGSLSSSNLRGSNNNENMSVIKIKAKSRTPRRSTSPVYRTAKNLLNLPLYESIPETFLVTESQSLIPQPLNNQSITPENRAQMVD